MAIFFIQLMGQGQPIKVELPWDDMDDLAEDSSRARFIVGHLADPDENGVLRSILISTNRIQCVLEGE